MNNILMIGVFIVVEILMNRLVSLIFRFMEKKHNSVHLRFTKSFVNVLISVILCYTLLQQFELTRDISKVLLQSGSLMIAIATFAAQQALGNVISGISLSVSKPYNDTIIRQYNGECCIVPNSVMDSAVITNTNFIENVGNFIEIEIGYDADIEKAMNLMQSICVNHELTLNTEENKVFIKTYTANGIILKTTVWSRNLDDSFQACSDIRVALVENFRAEGITIPYQTVTIS